MMKNLIIMSGLFLFLMTSCDYNDKYFDGYDDITITDVVQFEGDYTGDYPAEGYFTDRSALESAINTMLKEKFPFCDKGSTASIAVSFGDITPGFQSVDVSYELTNDDYDSMGEGDGEPGKYNNFDGTMDIDAYLTAFIAAKYSSLEIGQTVSISYKLYVTGSGTSTVSSAYQKEASGWVKIEIDSFVTDLSYTLETADYNSMGYKYPDFNSSVDIDHLLTNFLRIKYPYAKSGQTAEVTYNYYNGTSTAPVSRIYKNEGTAWTSYDPYVETVEISSKIAEMEYDGSNWILKRLMGGTFKITMAPQHYKMLVDWVKENKSEYKSTQSETEEFYFGASAGTYNNINNNYSTWKNHYNIGGQYNGKTDEEMQEIMDARMVEAITNILLPAEISMPDPGLTYIFVYNVYRGRGSGNYKMSFVYNDETRQFEVVSGITPE